jgi:hypothetical protein
MSPTPTFSGLGVTRNQSSEWQRFGFSLGVGL